MALDPKIALRIQALEELERRNKLGPDAAKMLAGFRAQGITKSKPIQQQTNEDRLETAKARDDARKSMDLLLKVEPQLKRVRELYGKTLKGAGPLKSIREYLPGQDNAAFDNAVATLTTLSRPTMRTPGEGSMSDFESKMAVAPMPGRYKFDGANEESLTGLQRLIDESRPIYAKRLGLPTPPPRGTSSDGWSISEE